MGPMGPMGPIGLDEKDIIRYLQWAASLMRKAWWNPYSDVLVGHETLLASQTSSFQAKIFKYI